MSGSASAIVSEHAIAGNLANVARDMFDTHIGAQEMSAGEYHNYRFSVLHPPAVAMDLELTNNGATAAVVMVDGVSIPVGISEIKSISNNPFFELRVVSGTNIQVIVQGIYLQTIRHLTGKNGNGKGSTWL